MRLTKEQAKLASFYWARIVAGKLMPKQLKESRERIPPFALKVEKENRRICLEKLEKKDPDWLIKFEKNLSAWLEKFSNFMCLVHDNGPQGLFALVFTESGVPFSLLPQGRMTMSFDGEYNIYIGDEKINAKQFMREAAVNAPSYGTMDI